MSRLLDFYRGKGTDSERRSLQEIRDWSDETLEEVHDYIQWLFPLAEPSRFNPDAPLLTAEDIAAFRQDDLLQQQLQRSFDRFLAFLGLRRLEGQIVEGPNFTARVPEVWAFQNHNWLRITRVLRCLYLLGLEDQARSFLTWLDHLVSRRRFPIGDDTLAFWIDAVGGRPRPD